ncbi:zinc-binding protein A33 [Tachysurus ichikawai]
MQIAETDRRLKETLKMTDPECIQMDEFKNEQLLCLTINLLLFIRSQVPVTKKLFQSFETPIYTAWHNGVPHELTHLTGRNFQCIGVFSSSYGCLVCFLGSDTMTPLYSFCAGTFTDALYQAICPGHDNQGTNWKPLLICDASRSAPTL